MTIVALDGKQILAALEQAQKKGIRGGAVHDYLHIVAAEAQGADKIYTLNVKDFAPECGHLVQFENVCAIRLWRSSTTPWRVFRLLSDVEQRQLDLHTHWSRSRRWSRCRPSVRRD